MTEGYLIIAKLSRAVYNWIIRAKTGQDYCTNRRGTPENNIQVLSLPIKASFAQSLKRQKKRKRQKKEQFQKKDQKSRNVFLPKSDPLSRQPRFEQIGMDSDMRKESC